MEAFYMKIIMRRDSVIFYFENNRIDNAVRRCFLNKTKPFYLELVLHHPVGAINDRPQILQRKICSPTGEKTVYAPSEHPKIVPIFGGRSMIAPTITI